MKLLTAAKMSLIFGAIFMNDYAVAYNLFETGTPAKPYTKWGPDTPGTGATITWSFIPAGTPGSIFCGSSCNGNSTDSLYLYSDPDNGVGEFVSLTSLLPSIQKAFDTWSSVANINFVYNPTDTGVAINDPTAVPPNTGEIRIGAFDGGSFGAVGYAPPPNGGTGEGDILFNSSFYFQDTSNPEGTPINVTYAPNDFSGLFLHELGHALGIDHSGDSSAVMCGYHSVDNPTTDCDYSHINRTLTADDIAAIQQLYGAPVPLPSVAWLFSTGLFILLGVANRRKQNI